MTCKDCFFYGCCILNRCSADADVSGCKVFELESLERKKDLVEVVRCKDCKHYKPQFQGAHRNCKTPYCMRCTAVKVSPDDFCSYGERKKGSGDE